MKTILATLLTLLLTAGSALSQRVPDSTRTSAWLQFQAQHGDDWQVRWDEATGTPASIRGSQARTLQLEGTTAEVRARSLLKGYSKLFAVRPAVDDFERRHVIEREGLVRVQMSQLYHGVRVEGGEYAVTTDQNGYLRMVTGRFWPDIDIETTPSVAPESAILVARSAVDFGQSRRDAPAELVVYPVDDGYELAYRVLLLEAEPVRDWIVFVSAVDGEVLKATDVTVHSGIAHAHHGMAEATAGHPLVMTAPSAVTTTGSGWVYLTNPNEGPVTTVDLPRLQGSGFTLNGTYVEAVNCNFVWNTTDCAGPNAFSSNATFHYDPSNIHFDEVNLYYHTDRVASDFFPSIGFWGLGRAIIAGAKFRQDWGNAIYDINDTQGIFFGTGDGVHIGNTAREDNVIYHEFSHAVVHHNGIGYPSPVEPRALHEGWSDYFAAAHTGDPRVGKWVTIQVPDMRTVDNDKVEYHYDNREDVSYNYLNPKGSAHAISMIWSGALWDLRAELGASTTDNLVVLGLMYLSSSPNFAEARDGLIMADVDFNSGANMCTIEDVLAARGIGTACTQPLSVNLSGSTWLEPGQQGFWSATASGGTGGDHTFRWYYNGQLRRTHTTTSNKDSYSDTAGSTNFTIKVEVDRGTETASDQLDVTIWDCQADPTQPCLVVGPDDAPDAFELYGNHPNPLTTATTVRFGVPETAHVSLVVVDLLGREVMRTSAQTFDAGYHEKVLDAGALPSGTYIYRLVAADEAGLQFVETRSMTILR